MRANISLILGGGICIVLTAIFTFNSCNNDSKIVETTETIQELNIEEINIVDESIKNALTPTLTPIPTIQETTETAEATEKTTVETSEETVQTTTSTTAQQTTRSTTQVTTQQTAQTTLSTVLPTPIETQPLIPPSSKNGAYGYLCFYDSNGIINAYLEEDRDGYVWEWRGGTSWQLIQYPNLAQAVRGHFVNERTPTYLDQIISETGRETAFPWE